jgi:fibronectin-binding autotransporter adhesin
VVNADGGTINGATTLSGGTLNADGATFGANPIANNGGVINVQSNTTASVENTSGGLNVLAGATLTGDVTNADITNVANTGVIAGTVDNSGTLNLDGLITGGDLANSGTVNANGSVTGNVTNESGGDFVVAAGDAASVGGTFTNSAGATTTIGTGGNLTATFTNAAGATLETSGTLSGALNNAGTVSGTNSIFSGAVTNSSTMTDTATMTLNGSLQNAGSGTINAVELSVAGTTNNNGTIRTSGAANFGTLNNAGTLTAGSLTATGQTTNTTTISTVGNMNFAGGLAGGGTLNVVDATINAPPNAVAAHGSSNDVITVGGTGITGGVTLQFDANLNPTAGHPASSDRLEMGPGAALTGTVTLEFAIAAGGGGVEIPDLLVIDVDEGAANNFVVAPAIGLPNSGGKFVYALDDLDIDNGDVYLRTFLNPGISGLAGNVTLTQSLIGSVINRPSSPFVSGLAYDDPDACGAGVWGRAIGGAANANGSTSDGRDSFSSELSASYAGVQLGGDFACFNGYFNGWDLAFGGIVGLNQGNVDQPVFAIDPNAPDNLSDVQTSTTTADFDQFYGGTYLAAVRGPLAIDLQYRVEKTDFDLTNTPLGGSTGLGLTGTQFSSRAQTLSGSVSYAFPIADTNLTVLPVAGFAWTKTKTDTIIFDSGDTLEVDDFDNQTGFVGATVARSVFSEDGNSAFNQFITATYYNDFADDPTSTFNFTDPTTGAAQIDNLVNENLGAYTELSVGLNYVRILNPGQAIPARQLNASVRADARFGGQLDSWGLTGQLRLQF